MIRLLLLFVSAVTLFAQRTPLKVNGSVVNNPNFINSPSLTWTIVGQDITGTAAGGPGGDTIWTNDNGTISASSTAGNGTNAFRVNAATTHTSGNLVEVQNNGTNAVYVTALGEVFARPNTGGFAVENTGGGFLYAYPDTLRVYADGGAVLNSQAVLDSFTPHTLDTGGITHTTGNLLEVKNNGTNKVQITPYGGLLLANGPDNGSDTDTLSNTYDLSKGDPDVTSINTYLVDSDGFNYYAQAILNMSITSSNAPTVSLNLGATPGDTGNESHINIRIAPAGTTDGSISTRVGSGAENISLYPNVNDGASPFTLFCEQVHTTGNLFELGNTSTNYIQVPVDQASTNAPLILLINGTQKRVHVGAPDSGGTGLRALTIEN